MQTHARIHMHTCPLKEKEQNMRKIALVSLDYIRKKDPLIPVGIASILQNLQSHGLPHEHFLYNVHSKNFDPKLCIDHLLASSVTDVLLGAFVWNEPYIHQILNSEVAKHKKCGVGGPQVSYCGPGELEKYYPQASFFIRGHAEVQNTPFNPKQHSLATFQTHTLLNTLVFTDGCTRLCARCGYE
jgi:hypothetical protein